VLYKLSPSTRDLSGVKSDATVLFGQAFEQVEDNGASTKDKLAEQGEICV